MSVDHIWNEAKRDHKHLILIFEDFPSRLGREVILDMVAYKHFLVRRMTKGSVQKFRIKHFPSMYLFLQDGRIEQLAKGSSTRQEFVQALLDLDNADKEEVNGQSVHISDSKNEQNEQNQENTADVEEKISEDKLIDGTSHKRQAVYMQDLESALTYCFRQEIAIHKEIEEEDLAALKAFVRVLARYFPGREEVQGFLLKVNHWLDQVTSGLTGMHWVHNIDSIQTVDTFLPETIEWIGCRGSQPQYRGYPCGMWTLFHTLSVSAYEMGKDSPKFLYKEVLHAIQGYMKHFFGCAVCSSHFLKMAKSVDSDVSSPEESVLWLWRAHNKANKRLHGDQSEDPQNLKVQFPPKSLCSDCQTDSSNPSSPKWNENHVLSFLTKFYRKENIIQIMSNQSFDPGSYQAKTRNDMDWWERQQRRKDLEKIAHLRQQKKDKNQQKWKALAVANQENQPKEKTLKREIVMAINNRSWLNGMDMGLCAMFYFLCLIIILLLYYHFMVKKKWKYCGKLF